MLCYDITSLQSFESLLHYKKHIDKYKKKDNVPIILVGTHCMSLSVSFYSLTISIGDNEPRRKVTPMQAIQLAKNYFGGCPTIEVSSKTGQHVDQAFHTLCKEIISSKVVATENPIYGRKLIKYILLAFNSFSLCVCSSSPCDQKTETKKLTRTRSSSLDSMVESSRAHSNSNERLYINPLYQPVQNHGIPP